MITFVIKDLNKWMNQNKAEIIETFPSVLLDYYVLSCKNGICFVFDQYVNSCASAYKAYYFRNDEINTEEYKRIELEWYDLYNAYTEEFATEE